MEESATNVRKGRMAPPRSRKATTQARASDQYQVPSATILLYETRGSDPTCGEACEPSISSTEPAVGSSGEFAVLRTRDKESDAWRRGWDSVRIAVESHRSK